LEGKAMDSVSDRSEFKETLEIPTMKASMVETIKLESDLDRASEL